jgi:MFS transporter, PAT family, beta-lactamase induction signal transducer AmpG
MSRAKTSESLRAALRSWRFGAVTLFSLSSGAPLGLVLTAVPAWMTMAGVDIKTVGIITLAQAPYAFKFVWSPLLDRYAPFLGRKRGWILVWQLVLAALVGGLATQAVSPEVGVVGALTLLIAFASASQDIAIDAYAVESLKPEEQGLAAGSRTALYRVGMWLSGNIAISVAPLFGWRTTLMLLALIYIACIPVTLFAPEPEVQEKPPRTLRAAVWEPFVGFFQRPRALEIAAFLVLYKLADNLATALTRPFLIQMGFSAVDVGVASGTIGLFATMAGTFVGGILSITMGLGRALWLFGVLQALAGLSFAVVASVGAERFVMYGAIAIEATTVGLATGALDVLLLRLTEKRFSATQYALYSSIFALGRTLVGPIAGVLVDAIGWRTFFVFTVFCALPGLFMLNRFAPLGARELAEETLGAGKATSPIGRGALVARSLAGVLLAAVMGLGVSALTRALKAAHQGNAFDLGAAISEVLAPAGHADYIGLVGIGLFAVTAGLGVAAYLAARRGLEFRGHNT